MNIKKIISIFKRVTNEVAKMSSLDESAVIINGELVLKNNHFAHKSVVNGQAHLQEDAICYLPLVVNGSFKSENVIVHEKLTINGCASIIASKINHDISISGDVVTRESSFKDIELLTKNARFYSSSFNNIVIKNLKNKSFKQVIYLCDQCIVSGDIVFESKNGLIYKDNTSKILGDIHGAVVNIL